jgi:Secretion system C-terminal sorting domain
MKIRNIVLFLIVANSQLQSQVLTEYTNHPKQGDKLYKYKIEYANPSNAGKDIRWNFGSLKQQTQPIGQCYFRKPNSSESSISLIDYRTVFDYKLSNDSVLLSGFTNPKAKVKYTHPELVLKYPFMYGDKAESSFSGEGIYCDRQKVKLVGNTVTIADASGVLITPDADTLKVIRIYRRKTTMETGLDSCTMLSETYTWYANGKRYPVIETDKTRTIKKGKEQAYYEISYYFKEQNELELNSKKSSKTKSNFNSNLSLTEESFMIAPNPVKTEFYLEFSIPEKAEVSYKIYDTLGHERLCVPSRQIEPGVYHEVFNTSLYESGHYIMEIIIGNSVYKKKIIKI